MIQDKLPPTKQTCGNQPITHLQSMQLKHYRLKTCQSTMIFLLKFVPCWKTSLRHELFCISCKTTRRKCFRNLFNSCSVSSKFLQNRYVSGSRRIWFFFIFIFIFIRSLAGPTLNISVHINQSINKQTKPNNRLLSLGAPHFSW